MRTMEIAVMSRSSRKLQTYPSYCLLLTCPTTTLIKIVNREDRVKDWPIRDIAEGPILSVTLTFYQISDYFPL